MSRNVGQACTTCKHWVQFHDPEAPEEYGGVHPWCLTLGKRWGRCERTVMSMGDAEDTKSIAVAMDGSQYRAALETREDFGCVQWEER